MDSRFIIDDRLTNGIPTISFVSETVIKVCVFSEHQHAINTRDWITEIFKINWSEK